MTTTIAQEVHFNQQKTKENRQNVRPVKPHNVLCERKAHSFLSFGEKKVRPKMAVEFPQILKGMLEGNPLHAPATSPFYV